MKQFVIATCFNLAASLFFRGLLWINDFNSVGPEGLDEAWLDKMADAGTLYSFMALTIYQLFALVKRILDERKETESFNNTITSELMNWVKEHGGNMSDLLKRMIANENNKLRKSPRGH